VVPNELDPERDIGEAVRAVRAGDTQAFATIVERFQRQVMTLCDAVLRDKQAAEELAQDVFVTAYQRLATFDVCRPMKPWLVKIAYRLAQQRWRNRVREAARQQKAVIAQRLDNLDPGPAEKVSVDERSEILWRAVSELPMAQRTAVILYYRENLTIPEVAEALDVSPGTVKTHLFRARSHIHESLQAKGFDEGDVP
jgi:RNA polymerase sigma-70 factor (ECF subfamily)